MQNITIKTQMELKCPVFQKTLNERDQLLLQRKISHHGQGSLDFFFLAGFMRTLKTIQTAFPHFAPILQYTITGESGYGHELSDALTTLSHLGNRRLNELLPASLEETLSDGFTWAHDDVQRELDHILVEKPDALYDLRRIPDQQDKVTMLSTDTSIFLIVPSRSRDL